MKKHLIFSILSVIICNAVFSQSDEKANILAVEKSTADAFTKHNVVYLNAVFADDVSVISSKGESLTKQQLIQFVGNINSVVVTDLQVKIKGTIAIVTGTELETGKNDAGAYSNKYKFTDVLEKVKGQWQITATQATSMDQ
ncbi:MAG: nuclear transport factor 2 family protein [Parafilimonas sp.]|nr:nuclear transport factor 2 family protein [Parafilimonas sp.]